MKLETIALLRELQRQAQRVDQHLSETIARCEAEVTAAKEEHGESIEAAVNDIVATTSELLKAVPGALVTASNEFVKDLQAAKDAFNASRASRQQESTTTDTEK